MIFKEEVCWMSSSRYLLEDIVKNKAALVHEFKRTWCFSNWL